MSYEFLKHIADVKFRAEGLSIEEMFVAAASALNETIYGDMKVLEQTEKNFVVEGKDWEGLVYGFLEEFLYLLDSENFLVSKVKLIEMENVEGNLKLKCVVVGDVADNYKFTNDVKAVTYSEMVVREENGKWICEVVLDV